MTWWSWVNIKYNFTSTNSLAAGSCLCEMLLWKILLYRKRDPIIIHFFGFTYLIAIKKFTLKSSGKFYWIWINEIIKKRISFWKQIDDTTLKINGSSCMGSFLLTFQNRQAHVHRINYFSRFNCWLLNLLLQ